MTIKKLSNYGSIQKQSKRLNQEVGVSGGLLPSGDCRMAGLVGPLQGDNDGASIEFKAVIETDDYMVGMGVWETDKDSTSQEAQYHMFNWNKNTMVLSTLVYDLSGVVGWVQDPYNNVYLDGTTIHCNLQEDDDSSDKAYIDYDITTNTFGSVVIGSSNKTGTKIEYGDNVERNGKKRNIESNVKSDSPFDAYITFLDGNDPV